MASLEIKAIAPPDCLSPKELAAKRTELTQQTRKTITIPAPNESTHEVTITVRSMPSDEEQFTAAKAEIERKLSAMGFKLD
ncbi:MAG: hypothetical protein KBA40_01870 [Candidatus Peribacteraceae bacterium]|nr:hypothetical protein [Candidatus Peribacteraceae bacterium]MBP9850367.1 hypothetical protein [Candidatus Peribacteraceae bacterium]